MRSKVGLILAALIVSALTVSLTGCGGGGGGGSSLSGVWMCVSAEADGKAVSLANVFDWSDDIVRQEIEFADGVVTLVSYDESGSVAGEETGTYTESGGTVTMVLGPNTTSFTYSTSGNVMTAEFTADLSLIEATFVRVVALSARDSALVGDWRILQMFENDGEVDPVDNFMLPPSLEAVSVGMVLQSDGTLIARQYDGSGSVLQEDSSGHWATGGGEFMLSESENQIRGYYSMNPDDTVTVTILTPDGNSVRIIMTQQLPV